MNQNLESDGGFPVGTALKSAKHKALWLGAFWLIGGVALMLSINPLLVKKRFAAFNNAAVNAPIEGINTADHGFAVQLRVKGSSYVFYPITSTGERLASDFVEMARVGDYVKKKSKSDTLYLMQRGTLHKILFKRY